MTSTEYLDGVVIYDGLPMRRGDVISDLRAIIATYDCPNPEAMVDRYMQSIDLANRLQAKIER